MSQPKSNQNPTLLQRRVPAGLKFSKGIYSFLFNLHFIKKCITLPLTVYKNSRLQSTIKLYSSTNN